MNLPRENSLVEFLENINVIQLGKMMIITRVLGQSLSRAAGLSTLKCAAPRQFYLPIRVANPSGKAAVVYIYSTRHGERSGQWLIASSAQAVDLSA